MKFMEQNKKPIVSTIVITFHNSDGKDIEFIVKGHPQEIYRKMYSFLQDLNAINNCNNYKYTCTFSKQKLKKYGIHE